MEAQDIIKWLDIKINRAQRELKELDVRRETLTKTIEALGLTREEANTDEFVDLSGQIAEAREIEESTFTFNVASTLHNHGVINIPARFADRIGGDGRGEIIVRDRPFRVSISRKQTRNRRPRLNGGAALKRMIREEFNLGDKVEVHIESPKRFVLCRLSREDTVTDL